jgi:hypothetical protein
MAGPVFLILADLILLLHFAFILFVVGGGLLAWRWPRLVPWHLAAAAWGAVVALTNRVCPLTPLENLFLARAGRAGYAGGFIDRYLAPIVYPEGLSPRAQAALGVLVIVWNAGVYALARRRRAAAKGATRGSA